MPCNVLYKSRLDFFFGFFIYLFIYLFCSFFVVLLALFCLFVCLTELVYYGLVFFGIGQVTGWSWGKDVPTLTSARPKEVAWGWALGSTDQGQEVSRVVAMEAFATSGTFASVPLPGWLSGGMDALRTDSPFLHIFPMLTLTSRRMADLEREGMFMATSNYVQWHKALVKTYLLIHRVIVFFYRINAVYNF